MEKLKVLQRFYKNNPQNKLNPVYRYKALENKQKLVKKYNTDVYETNYKKLQEADLIDKEVLQREGEYIRTLEDEIQKHWILTELNSKFDLIQNKIPIEYEEGLKALEELPQHSNIMKLPKGLVTNAKKSFDNITQNGVPHKSEVEINTKLLANSLKTLVEVINYERFEDLTIEDLASRVRIQNYKHYYFWFKSLFSSTIIPNNLTAPTKDNFPSYSKLVDEYKKADQSEKDDLHKIDLLESYITNKDYLQAYTILKNNSKFLDYVEGGKQQLQTIEDYLVYQTLTEINFIQNIRKIS